MTAAVLLGAVGSDYNVFVAGRVWQEARERPTRDAMAIAAPRSAKAIVVAGITLALSFGALALVPLRSFRELAFALACGVLLETVLVRALLVPAARAGAAVGDRGPVPGPLLPRLRLPLRLRPRLRTEGRAEPERLAQLSKPSPRRSSVRSHRPRRPSCRSAAARRSRVSWMTT